MDSPAFGIVIAILGIAGGAAVSAALTAYPAIARALLYLALFVCWACVVLGGAIAIPKLLPGGLRPTGIQMLLYALSIFAFGTTLAWQRISHEESTKGPKIMAQVPPPPLTPPSEVVTQKGHAKVTPTKGMETPHVLGLDVRGDHQGSGNAAYEILSTGTENKPAIGADVTIHALPGQSATGVRIVQNGPGTGMRIIQNGPGVGLRVNMISGGPTNNIGN